MDKDGKISYSKITNINKYFSNEVYDVFEMSRFKKKLYTCTANHLIPVYHAKRTRKIKNRPYEWEIREYTAKELSKLSKHTLKCNNLGITSFPIDKYQDSKNCEIEPYCLGVYLGDGYFGFKNLEISNSNHKILEEISKFYEPYNLKIRKGKTINKIKIIIYSINSNFAELLRKHNLYGKKSGNKFIPKEALLSDINYRKRLLAGLIDTDGYIRKNGSISISTKSRQLARNINDLVFSLGGRASINKITKKIKKLNFKGDYFNVNIYLQCILPLQNKFKKDRINNNYAYNSANRLSIKLRKAKPCKVVGIEIDSPSKWFLVNNWNITHNSMAGLTLCIIHSLLNSRQFTMKYVCANEFDYIERLQNMPEIELINSIFLQDEQKNTAYGTGSVAKRMKILDVQNIIAINNISTIVITPDRFGNEKAFYGFRVFGKGVFKNKPFTEDGKPNYNQLTRLMLYNLQEGSNGLPMGMCYIPTVQKLLPEKHAQKLEKEYLDKKNEWVTKEMRGESDTLMMLKKNSAERFVKDDNFMGLKKKDEKITFISMVLGSEWTKGECLEVFNLTELIRKGINFDAMKQAREDLREKEIEANKDGQ
jgi:hypothetical protein